MIKISPSILSSDFSKLGEECAKVCANGADLVHIDVMDGCFVPNLTFGAPVIKSIKKYCTAPLDVHLMINKPENLLDDFIAAGADIITIHEESTEKTKEIIKKLHSKGVKASVAIKPGTPADVVFPYLSDLDMVLVMTVEPGFGGQSLIESTIEKVAALRKKCNELGLSTDIEVDGGIKVNNVEKVSSAGADVIVAGSAVFKADDMKKVITELRDNAAKHYLK